MLKLPVQKIFNGLLIYYWLLLYSSGFVSEVQRFSVLYFMFEIPIVIYLILMGKFLFGIQSKLSILLWMFLIPILVVSAVRLDFNTMLTISLTILTIITILNSKVKIDLRLLNALFFMSIFMAIFFYYLGLSKYGFLPGMTKYRGIQFTNEQWRISLFPSLADSGLFSCFVLILNFYYNQQKWRKYLLMFLSFYFLIFTGIRSAILLVIVFIIFLIVNKIRAFKPTLFYVFYNWILIFLTVLLFFSGTIILNLRENIHNDTFRKIIFRSKDKTVSEKNISNLSQRTWIWQQHFKIFLKHPVIGVGTFKFSEVVKGARSDTVASESPLTSLLARVGLLVIPLLLFFWSLWLDALFRLSFYPYLLPSLLIIAMLTYGSFFSPYNFIFLVIFASYNEVY